MSNGISCKPATAQPREEMTVTLPNGSERKGKTWETSPLDVAKDLSKSLAERVVIAKVRMPKKKIPVVR